MLQQILKDMYIDPDVLEALNEDQKKTLFLKMRQEQVRRWHEHEDKLEREGGDAVKRTKPRKANSKSVSWLLGRDGDVAVIVIGEVEELSAKFICSGLGEKKSPPSLQNNTQNESILTNRKTIEPNRTVTECLSSETSTVQLKPKCEETSTLPPLPVSVSEHSSPPAADKQPDSEPLSKTEERSDPQSPVYTKLLVRSNAVTRAAASEHLNIRAGVTVPKPFTATQPPSPSTIAPISPTAKTEPAAYTSKAMQMLENPKIQEVLRGKDEPRVTVRSALGNITSSGKVTPPCTGRGKVAQLMKAFSTETSPGPPQSPGQTPTRGTKPPLPTKPSHLRATTTPSVR